jgi:copper chaperone CopZ
MTTSLFNVPDMHCSSCAMTLEGLEDELAGIKRISASYHKQRLEVEYDEKQLTGQAIIAAAAELGYTLVPAQ